VPTWFDWDGQFITVHARSDAQKVRNVRNHPWVMLAIGTAEPAFEVELVEGEARVAEARVGEPRAAGGQHDFAPGPRPSARFATKYAEALASAGWSLSSFLAEYPCALLIRPTRLLDWGAREQSLRRVALSATGTQTRPADYRHGGSTWTG
jgi:hypothetical protein